MNLEQKIIDYFSKKSGIASIYLFGSVTRLELKYAEDVDLAVLYEINNEPSELDRFQDQQYLSDKLGKEVDLIVMNSALVVLRMQILKKGKQIVVNNRKTCNAFIVRTMNEYFDLKQIRKPVEQKLAEFPILG